MKTTGDYILKRMRKAEKGAAFTAKDFLDLAGYEAAKKSLGRLADTGTLRRILRGVYDFPAYSPVKKGPATPRPDAVAHAIARAHGWTLIPTGETALNLLGLSTQVPAQWQYCSNGPTKCYQWPGGNVLLKHCAGRQTSGLASKTILIVQALKALGRDAVTDEVLGFLRHRLTVTECRQAVSETRHLPIWMQSAIKCLAEKEGTHA